MSDNPITVTTATAKLLADSKRRRLSKRTIEFYENRLGLFCERFGDKLVHDLTRVDLEDFISGLTSRERKYTDHPYRDPVDEPLSTAYVRGVERAIRRLLNFSECRGWISQDQNPWRQYERVPKDKTREPKAWDTESLSLLLQAPNTNPTYQIRDRAILHLLVDTGCRLGGVANLQLNNVDWQLRRFDTVEKRQWCTYRFSKRTADVLRQWLQKRPETDHTYVFVNPRTGRRLTKSGIQSMVTRVKERLGIAGPGVHAIRHWYVNNMLQSGVNLKAVSQLVNHSTVSVTGDIYGWQQGRDLDRMHDAASPLDDLTADNDENATPEDAS